MFLSGLKGQAVTRFMIQGKRLAAREDDLRGALQSHFKMESPDKELIGKLLKYVTTCIHLCCVVGV